MGTFQSKHRVWNPAHPEHMIEMEAWVDTGAAYSWIRRSRLEPLGIVPVYRMQFRTIEGRASERAMAAVFLAADGHTGGDNVVMAEPGDMEVIGAHSLDALGLSADPVQKKLVPMGVALALSHSVVRSETKS